MNSRVALMFTAICVMFLAAVAAASLKYEFETDPVGVSPPAFLFARTGAGQEAQWVVRPEKGAGTTNHVLVQESTDKVANRFPLAVLKDGEYKDVTLSVRAKPLAGQVDQGFGLVWRYRDANNYYIARCNALEDNCTIYHVVSGRRVSFQNQNVKVATNRWHTLKVEAVTDHFVVWCDDKVVLDARDRTLEDAGKVGLWTKADSVVEFDDLSVEGR